jgi:hypothetical protein
METQPPPSYPTEPTPQRHGCVLAWLILMIVANASTALITPFSLIALRQNGANVGALNIALVVLCATGNIICAVALLRWRKWGFYGFLVTTIVALANNLMIGLGIGVSLIGLLGIIVLYAVLQIGGPQKAWPQLK